MIWNKIFRKYFALIALTLLAFIALSFFMNSLILRMADQKAPMHSPVFFARLLDELGKDRVASLQKMENLNQGSLPFQFSLLDANGKTIAGLAPESPLRWEADHLPTEAYSFQNVERLSFHGFFPGGPGPGGLPPPHHDPDFPRDHDGPEHGGPGGPGGPPPPPKDHLIRLPGEPAQFLLVSFRPTDAQHRPPPFQFFLISMGMLVISVLLGVGVALSFLFRSLQKKVALADSVIAELQKGNLKARFPIKKRDEFGQAMARFNQMADEIELLVERLTNTEKSRMTLLQELAHDLRTPVASMKNLLETLQSKRETLSPKLQNELISLSVKEIEYFDRLIEDLLILAQVSEPRYHTSRQPTDLVSIFDEESESVALNYLALNADLQLTKTIPDTKLLLQGDTLLIRRMFRNALENAFSFAKKEVTISVEAHEAQVKMRITDDGPGFSADSLAAYGIRRMTRALGTQQDGRLSVGLGSVILKTAAEIHRGSVKVENRIDSNGRILGASVTITLPLFT